MGEQALGVIETMGLVPAIEAADISLKTAEVSLSGLEMVGAGRVTIKLRGDVSSVKASVDAGKSAALRLGKVLGATVIARTAEGLEKVTEPVESAPEERGENTSKEKEGKESPAMPANMVPGREELDKMSVVDLRTMVRNLPDSPMGKDKIRSARKQDLIEAILTYYHLEP